MRKAGSKRPAASFGKPFQHVCEMHVRSSTLQQVHQVFPQNAVMAIGHNSMRDTLGHIIHRVKLVNMIPRFLVPRFALYFFHLVSIGCRYGPHCAVAPR